MISWNCVQIKMVKCSEIRVILSMYQVILHVNYWYEIWQHDKQEVFHVNFVEIYTENISLTLWKTDGGLGPNSIKRCHLTSIGNPIVEIRWSYDRLISTMGFPIPVRRHLYIESGPWCFTSGAAVVMHWAININIERIFTTVLVLEFSDNDQKGVPGCTFVYLVMHHWHKISVPTQNLMIYM